MQRQHSGLPGAQGATPQVEEVEVVVEMEVGL
jgi:hypothetical protein